jgi:DNA-binding CsgD family transcriptional regulator
LRGREIESAELESLIASVHAGRSATLVLRGEAGIGKTALLEDAIERGRGCQVVRTVGIESEMELAFAALQQMCAPLIDGLERMPAPQRDALATAFGLSAGPPPDRFLVGLAVLSLLADAASRAPLIGVVDDAQWLDQSSAQTLSFVARRLHAESVLLLFAERDQEQPAVLQGLPELRLHGLPDVEARALLTAPTLGQLDERVRDRIIAEARGNPLALLELPRGLLSTSLTGAFGAPDGSAPPAHVEASFHERVVQLPEATQLLLLVGAAEPLGDTALLWRAAEELDIPLEALAPATAADLIRVGTRVTFRHPLLRSAIYSGASAEARRTVHRALADATDPEVDPDRLAWHLAQATLAPDELVALELERAAHRARARGGLGAAAAFLERSADLTPDPARRAGRALAAAEFKQEAGAFAAAEQLVRDAVAGPLDGPQRARAKRLQALIASVRHDLEAPSLLLTAARQLEPHDPSLADQTYLEALTTALMSGNQTVLRDMARAISDAPPAQHPRPAELLVTGWARLYADGFPAGTDILRQALVAFQHEPLSTTVEIQGLWLACGVAKAFWDESSWRTFGQRYLQLTREAGALAALPRALNARAQFLIESGEFSAAAALVAESQTIVDAMGITPSADIDTPWTLAAWRNDPGISERLDTQLRDARRRNAGWMIVLFGRERALLSNALGRSDEAMAAAQIALDHREFGGTARALIELIEAACHAGNHQVAAAGLEELTERTRLSGTDWALGVEARLRALLHEGQQAEDLHREALDLLGRTCALPAQGRARLAYGEWLRRENRRVESRTHLREAYELFSTIGAGAFAERARRELMATGETMGRRHADTRHQLTAQEGHIAHLAADGHTNREIGAQLYLSQRTIEWHLTNVFTKLGLTSRRELRALFPDRLPA